MEDVEPVAFLFTVVEGKSLAALGCHRVEERRELRVLCDFHNQLAAKQVCGEPWMSQFTSRSETASGEEGAPGGT